MRFENPYNLLLTMYYLTNIGVPNSPYKERTARAQNWFSNNRARPYGRIPHNSSKSITTGYLELMSKKDPLPLART